MKIPRRTFVLALVAVLALGLLLVVVLTRPAPPDTLTTPSEFTGWVLGVKLDSRQIVVESQAQKIVRRVTVTVTEDTLILRREGGKLRSIGLFGVRLQDQAELWLTGPVPEDFPAQVTAKQVVVERTP
jgi:hypothetical protein